MRSVKGVAAGAAILGMVLAGCGAENGADGDGGAGPAKESGPALPTDGPYIQGELGGCFLPETDAAQALAQTTSSEFVPAEAGHGWELVVEEGRLTPLGQQVLTYAAS